MSSGPPKSSSNAAAETPLRVLTSGAAKPKLGPGGGEPELIVVDVDCATASDARVEAILPTPATVALASDPSAFRAAYRLELFSNASAVGEVVAAHRHAPMVVVIADSRIARAVAPVLDEFFAAWAPC